MDTKLLYGTLNFLTEEKAKEIKTKSWTRLKNVGWQILILFLWTVDCSGSFTDIEISSDFSCFNSFFIEWSKAIYFSAYKCALPSIQNFPTFLSHPITPSVLNSPPKFQHKQTEKKLFFSKYFDSSRKV